jgi:hypothetical protein
LQDLKHVSIVGTHVAQLSLLKLAESNISRRVSATVLSPACRAIGDTTQQAQTDEALANAVARAVEVDGVLRLEGICRDDA